MLARTVTTVSRRSFIAVLVLSGALLSQAASAERCKYFIEISVDGLGSVYLQPMVEKERVTELQAFSDGRGLDQQRPQ